MLYNRVLWRIQSKILSFMYCLTFAFPDHLSYSRRDSGLVNSNTSFYDDHVPLLLLPPKKLFPYLVRRTWTGRTISTNRVKVIWDKLWISWQLFWTVFQEYMQISYMSCCITFQFLILLIQWRFCHWRSVWSHHVGISHSEAEIIYYI